MTSPLDEKAVAAAHEAYAKTTGGLLDGNPMANAIRAYLSATALPDGMERFHFDNGNHSYGTDGGSMLPHEEGEWVRADQAQSALAAMRVERDEAKGKLALIVDRIVYSDSYGVPGSDFQCCHLCTGGGAPGVPFEHDERCPIRRVDRDYDQWFEDIRTTEDALRETEDRLAAAEQQVRDMSEVLRCHVTGNPPGTDTRRLVGVGTRLVSSAPCSCPACRLLLKEGGE